MKSEVVETRKVWIAMGPLAPTLRMQLEDQGIKKLARKISVKLATLDIHRAQITRLLIAGILSEGEARKARVRLIKKIVRELEAAL